MARVMTLTKDRLAIYLQLKTFRTANGSGMHISECLFTGEFQVYLGKRSDGHLSGKDVNEYRENMNKFNPVKFDAAAVVKLAKDAGMKYITFTTRHHDSFSMFNTKYSDWGIMNTPYGKDVLKMLV